MKTLLIQFEKTEQVTEDSWRIVRPSMMINSEASLNDVLNWVTSKNNNRLPEKIEIREVDVIHKNIQKAV